MFNIAGGVITTPRPFRCHANRTVKKPKGLGWEYQAAAVNAPIALLLHAVLYWWRATAQRR
jgi:hypothetical protein